MNVMRQASILQNNINAVRQSDHFNDFQISNGQITETYRSKYVFKLSKQLLILCLVRAIQSIQIQIIFQKFSSRNCSNFYTDYSNGLFQSSGPQSLSSFQFNNFQYDLKQQFGFHSQNYLSTQLLFRRKGQTYPQKKETSSSASINRLSQRVNDFPIHFQPLIKMFHKQMKHLYHLKQKKKVELLQNLICRNSLFYFVIGILPSFAGLCLIFIMDPRQT